MKKLFLVVMVCSAFLLIGNSASAVPLLQLDIVPSVYDSTTETIVASSDDFTLYALLTPIDGTAFAIYDTTYFISIALLPQTNSLSGFGSFEFDPEGSGPTTYTSMTNFGTPLNLPSHGIFDTAYMEFAFDFLESDTVGTYNTMDDPGGFGSFPGDGTYYAAFDVDTSLLDSDVIIHFDLYSKVWNGNKGVLEIDKFAPFSHDAQSVPEPATMLLLGSGLLGMGVFGRKKFKS